MSSPSIDPRRVAVVTGGASGIGWSICRRLAARGDRVVIFDRAANVAERARELGEGHIGLICNIAEEAAVVGAFATVLARCGRIDVLVNNAGVVDAEARPAIDAPLDGLRELLAINLDGAFVAAREAGRAMLAQGRGGAIVNVASLVGLVAIPNRSGYSMSKAAMIGMTRALACEWAAAGIRVNAVLPGYVATEIIATLGRGGKIDLGQVERRIPLGRLAEPDEIAAVVEHLAAPETSYVTGALLVADGGYQAFGGTAAASSGGSSRAQRLSGPRGVIVTGGASGIGAAIARHFARLGDRVLIFDRERAAAEELAAELGSEHRAAVGSVTCEADASAAIHAAHAAFGRIDVLINNVGIADSFEPTVAQSLSESAG